MLCLGNLLCALPSLTGGQPMQPQEYTSRREQCATHVLPISRAHKIMHTDHVLYLRVHAHAYK